MCRYEQEQVQRRTTRPGKGSHDNKLILYTFRIKILMLVKNF